MQAGDTDPEMAPSTVWGPILQHLLNASVACGLHKMVMELIDLRQRAPLAAVVSLPSPSRKAQRLQTQLPAEDNMEAYLHTFEMVVRRECWPERDWSDVVAPLLTREVQRAHYTLSKEEATNFYTLKTEILAGCGLSSTQAAAQFHHWSCSLHLEPRARRMPS